MTKITTPRFDPATIEQLADNAGTKCHARGMAYAEQGQVGILAIAHDRVIAEAFGTETYSLRLTGSGERIGGQCSCPAFDDAGFCKHMVAAMLVTNALLEAGEGTDRICDGIADYVASFSPAELRNYVQTLAETNSLLFRTLAAQAGLEPREDFEHD